MRARVLRINNAPYERAVDGTQLPSREEEEEIRFRNRGVNLSSRAGLQTSETLVSGSQFSPRKNNESNEPWRMSVEEQYAKRIGLRLGDVVAFDIQGVEVLGVVHNLRSVRWNSFQPNFFIVFEPGPLDEAPKTFLANIAAVPQEKRDSLQNSLSEKFPNISIVDVAGAAKKIIALLKKMNASIFLMSLLVGISGLAVLATVLSLEIKERSADYFYFRLLGASNRDLRKMLFFEGAFVLFLSLGIGSLGSIALSSGIMFFVFKSSFTVSWLSLFFTNSIIFLLAVLLGAIVSRPITRQDPIKTFRDRT